MAAPIYPMIGFGMGTLPRDQIFVDIEFVHPPLRPDSEAEVLRVRMPREQARELGQALLEIADIPHKPQPRH
jgi:hypothetical protein